MVCGGPSCNQLVATCLLDVQSGALIHPGVFKGELVTPRGNHAGVLKGELVTARSNHPGVGRA